MTAKIEILSQVKRILKLQSRKFFWSRVLLFCILASYVLQLKPIFIALEKI